MVRRGNGAIGAGRRGSFMGCGEELEGHTGLRRCVKRICWRALTRPRLVPQSRSLSALIAARIRTFALAPALEMAPHMPLAKFGRSA